MFVGGLRVGGLELELLCLDTSKEAGESMFMYEDIRSVFLSWG